LEITFGLVAAELYQMDKFTSSVAELAAAGTASTLVIPGNFSRKLANVDAGIKPQQAAPGFR
jgi:hypothetical protein